MAYSELIKNFNRTRAYIRSFYVYGFRHRMEFDQKSARSYDDERRRVESWLGDYMSFGQDAEGRRVFLSVDSRAIPENPLYRAFRAKTFTDRDIMLHFHLLDILSDTEGFPISVIMDELAAQLSEFHSDDLPDESTVRKKLKEYVELGIVRTEKRGRETCYLLSEDSVDLGKWSEAIAFFSEAAPVGVIGSFLQDRLPERFSFFRFKHHYILNALDNEVLCELLMAINEKKTVSFTSRNRRITVLPRKLYIGTQSGRQYLLAWSPENRKFSFYRTDLIDNVKTEGKVQITEALLQKEADFCSHTWGVSANNREMLDHLEMVLYVGKGEEFIVQRLNREKRCGAVEQVDESHWRFSADVLDALEMLPWLRTFTGRITELECSNKQVTERFWSDFNALTDMYGGKKNAVS